MDSFEKLLTDYGKPVEIVITVNTNKTISFTGPLHEKEWCVKALEIALETLKNIGTTKVITDLKGADSLLVNHQ